MTSHARKTALITGAGGQLGQVISETLLRNGYRLALVSRDAPDSARLQKRLESLPGWFITLSGNFLQAEEAGRIVEQARRELQEIGLAVNTMGGWLGGKRLHEHSADELNRMLDLNVRSAFHLMRAVLPVMQHQGNGKLINVISLNVFESGANAAAYTASKSALLALSTAAAAEYREDGIRVFTLAPGTIDTPANRKAMPNADRSRWVNPATIAETVLFIGEHGDSLSQTTFKFTG